MMDIILPLVRLYFGLGIAAHGAQKLFGWFGGYGLNATGEFMTKLGWREGRFFGTAAAAAEFGGGLLVALGLLWPLGPALMLLMMLTATLSVHVKNGFFSDKKGFEMPMLYGMGAVLLAFTGPGEYSLDRLFGLDWFYSERWDWIAIGVAVVIALVNLAVRKPAPQPAK
jgi:putative oxidoreductase